MLTLFLSPRRGFQEMPDSVPGLSGPGPLVHLRRFSLEENFLISDADEADLPIGNHLKTEIHGTDKDSWAENGQSIAPRADCKPNTCSG